MLKRQLYLGLILLFLASVLSAIEVIPQAPQGLRVSEGKFPDKIELAWEPVSGGGITYTVYRNPIFSLKNFLKPLAKGLKNTHFKDTTVPAGHFYYQVIAYNERGQESLPSDAISGYRQASVEEFTHLTYYETVTAEKRMAQSLGMIRVSHYIIPTTREIKGDLGGKVTYKLRILGISGKGSWDFKHYKNHSLTLNGFTSMSSNIKKDGLISGVIDVSGIYTGTLEYNLIVRSGNVFGGHFLVTYDGMKQRVNYSHKMSESPY